MYNYYVFFHNFPLLFCLSFVFTIISISSSFLSSIPFSARVALRRLANIEAFSHPPSSFLSPASLHLSPLSSRFHAARWAVMLCVFIPVCGRGGSLVPAANGLLKNTDSHTSQSGELGREGGRRIWSEAERESDFRREMEAEAQVK